VRRFLVGLETDETVLAASRLAGLLTEAVGMELGGLAEGAKREVMDVARRHAGGEGLGADDGGEIHVHMAGAAGGKEGCLIGLVEEGGEGVFNFKTRLAEAGAQTQVQLAGCLVKLLLQGGDGVGEEILLGAAPAQMHRGDGAGAADEDGSAIGRGDGQPEVRGVADEGIGRGRDAGAGGDADGGAVHLLHGGEGLEGGTGGELGGVARAEPTRGVWQRDGWGEVA
jgi:hypothetical protein